MDGLDIVDGGCSMVFLDYLDGACIGLGEGWTGGIGPAVEARQMEVGSDTVDYLVE